MTIIATVGDESTYTTNVAIGGAQSNFINDNILASDTGTLSQLRVKINEWYTSSQAKFVVYVNRNLMDVIALTSGDGVGIIARSLSGGAVSSGDEVEVAVITNGGYIRLAGITGGNYYKDTTSTYASPSDPLPAGAFQGGGTFWWEVSADVGPTLSVSTDPITGSVSGTTTQSTTATDYRITAGGVSVTRALDGSPVTGTSFAISALDRGSLPCLASVADTGAQALVELINGVTVVSSDNVDLGNKPGTTGRVVSGPDTVSANSILNPLYASETPVNGDQFRFWGDPGVDIDATGKVTGAGAFTVEYWTLATGTYGSQASYTVSGGVITTSGIIVSGVIINGLIK